MATEPVVRECLPNAPLRPRGNRNPGILQGWWSHFLWMRQHARLNAEMRNSLSVRNGRRHTPETIDITIESSDEDTFVVPPPPRKGINKEEFAMLNTYKFGGDV